MYECKDVLLLLRESYRSLSVYVHAEGWERGERGERGER